MDKPLQNYIEHNETYGMVMSENMITPINHFNVSIGTRYVECWNDFYEKRYSPCLEKRYIKSHTELMIRERGLQMLLQRIFVSMRKKYLELIK